MTYTVSMAVDGRVDVTVEAESFEDAFAKSRGASFDPNAMEVIGLKPVNATDCNGSERDY